MKQRADAAESLDARGRLVAAALRLFAEKGYAGASTREICEAAGANVSAIRYYFGGKAGLYRSTFAESMAGLPGRGNREAYAGLPLPAALELLLRDFLEPLKRGEASRLVMRLRFREMVEPSGAWRQEVDAEIKPQHDALAALLQRHLGLAQADADTHRLAFTIIGMAVHFCVGRDAVSRIAPALLADAEAVDLLAQRLAGYALAMIEGEARRLQDASAHAAR